MSAPGTAHVRALAFLHTLQRDAGRLPSQDVVVPREGVGALALARSIGIDPARIEGLFLNHRVSGTDAVIRPGDRVAFVPYGTPASHPAFFGPFVTRA